MQEWLNNSWVTGIGGGIFSGLIVFFITKWLFSDQSKREISQKVMSANREIIYAIREGIPDGIVADRSTIESLRSATARRCGVEVGLLLDNRGLVDELIKEVMDNSFISAKTKKEYCAKLHGIVDDIGPPQEDVVSKTNEAQERLISSTRFMGTLSASLATMAGMMVAVVTVVAGPMGDISDRLSESPIDNPLILAVVATTLATSISLLAIIAARRVESSKAEQRRREASRAYEVHILEHTRNLSAELGVKDTSNKS